MIVGKDQDFELKVGSDRTGPLKDSDVESSDTPVEELKLKKSEVSELVESGLLDREQIEPELAESE